MINWYAVPKNKLKYGITLRNFEGMLFHTGELPGYNTLIDYSPAEEFTIIISTNIDTLIKEKDTLTTPVMKVFDEIEKVLSPQYIKDRWKK